MMAKAAKGAKKPEKPVKKFKPVVIRETLMERAADMIHDNCDPSGLIKFLLSDQPITREDREDIAALLGGRWQGVVVEIRRTVKAMPSTARQRLRLFNYVNSFKRQNDGEMPLEAWEALAKRFKRSVKTLRNAYGTAKKEQRLYWERWDNDLSKVDINSDE